MADRPSARRSRLRPGRRGRPRTDAAGKAWQPQPRPRQRRTALRRCEGARMAASRSMANSPVLRGRTNMRSPAGSAKGWISSSVVRIVRPKESRRASGAPNSHGWFQVTWRRRSAGWSTLPGCCAHRREVHPHTWAVAEERCRSRWPGSFTTQIYARQPATANLCPYCPCERD